jgi:hypothetical protein
VSKWRTRTSWRRSPSDRDGFRLLAGVVYDLDLARLRDEEPGVAELFPGVEPPWLRLRAAVQRNQVSFDELREGDVVQVVLGHLATSFGGATVPDLDVLEARSVAPNQLRLSGGRLVT